jgi:chromate transport protein ChrA
MQPEGPTEELREIGDYEENSRPTRLRVTEVIRAVLAFIFAVFLLIVIVWGFLNTRGGHEVWTATKELLQLLLPAITALLGSAVGFYFGTQKGQ